MELASSATPAAELPPLCLIRDGSQAVALMQPERLRLLETLAQPNSASGLSRRFSVPRQRLNYHLRELERVGLVRLVEERKKGNCVERIVRATARSYVISPEVLGSLGRGPELAADRFSVHQLLELAARAIREVGSLFARAREAGKRLATLSLEAEIRFASAEDRTSFAEELASAVARLGAKYNRPGARDGRDFRLLACVYPKPSDAADVTPPEAR